MSGGHFDYQEYRLNDFADEIQRQIDLAKKPKPEKVARSFISIFKLQKPDGSVKTFLSHPELPSVQAGVKWVENWELSQLKKCEQENLYANEFGDLYEIQECTVWEYPDDEAYAEWSEETLEHMRTAVRLLRMAAMYVHRIDYLLCGDDGEETFNQKIMDELVLYDTENPDARD